MDEADRPQLASPEQQRRAIRHGRQLTATRRTWPAQPSTHAEIAGQPRSHPLVLLPETATLRAVPHVNTVPCEADVAAEAPSSGHPCSWSLTWGTDRADRSRDVLGSARHHTIELLVMWSSGDQLGHGALVAQGTARGFVRWPQSSDGGRCHRADSTRLDLRPVSASSAAERTRFFGPRTAT